MSITRENIKTHFNLLDYKAQCKYCPKEYNVRYTYVGFDAIVSHLRSPFLKHEDHFESLIRRKINNPQIYMKYAAYPLKEIKCRICETFVQSVQDLYKHVLHNHFKGELIVDDIRTNMNYYWKPYNDFQVKCTLCEFEITLHFIPTTLSSHIQETHKEQLENMQEAYNVAGPSGN